MSRLEDLIQTLCPDGVEYKRLKEIGAFFGGLTGKTKQDFQNGNKKFISYMNVYKNPAIDTTTEDFVRIAANERQNTVEYGDILFTGSSETPEECGISSVMTNQPDEPFYMNSFTIGFRLFDPRQLNPEFSKHLFRSAELRKQINKTANGVTRFNVSKVKLADVVIPLPPLPVQKEIVRILDTFSGVVAELEAEQAARVRQYEYYRDELFINNSNVPVIDLGNLCEFVRGPFGGSLKKEIFINEGFAVYEQQHAIYGDFTFRYFIDQKKFDEMKRFQVKPGDLIMSCSGTMGKVTIIPKNAKEGVINQALLKLRVNNRLNKYFLKYIFQSKAFINALNSRTQGGAIKNVASVAILKTIPIPVPPFEIQEQIVSILDRFDTLVNDLKSGLPAEIALRRKQYEYYRDKLLTFQPLK